MNGEEEVATFSFSQDKTRLEYSKSGEMTTIELREVDWANSKLVCIRTTMILNIVVQDQKKYCGKVSGETINNFETIKMNWIENKLKKKKKKKKFST